MEDFEVYLGMKVVPFQNTCGSWKGGAWARSDSLYVVHYDEQLHAWLLNDECCKGAECDAFNACDFEPFDYGWTGGFEIPENIVKSAEKDWLDRGYVIPERNSIEWRIMCVEWMVGKTEQVAEIKNGLMTENERLSNQNFDLRTENKKLREELDKYDDGVCISQEKYIGLLNSQELLNALREFGVDNWNGYSDAVQSLG